MPQYYVKMKIDFSGYIDADTPEQAEELAWDNWGDTMDKAITYDGVDIIHIEEEEDEDEDEEDDEG